MFYAAAYFYLKKTLLTILICFLAVKDDLIQAKNDACLCKSGPRSKLKVFVRKRKNNR